MSKTINTTRKKTKVVGTETYINQKTGELCEMNVVTVEERDANFHKIWLGHIIQALEMIGNQKIKVLTFILDNLDKENQLIMTQRKIAEKSGVSYPVVSATLKALQDADLVDKINSGAYKVNPEKIFKGGHNDRMRVLFDYRNIKNENEIAATNQYEEEKE